MPFLEQGSRRIYYDVTGDGPALILIHGAGGGGEGWYSDGYVEAFSANFKTVTLDLRGFGRSSSSEALPDFSMTARIDDVRTILDHLAIERASFFGFSMGGRVVVALAAEYPEQVRCLVVGSSNPMPMRENLAVAEGRSFANRFRRLTPRRAVAAAWRRINPRARRAMRNRVSPTVERATALEMPGEFDEERAAQVQREVMRQLTIDADRAAERLTMPTLFFQGDRDDLFSARLSREFTERLPHGEFVALRGQGHAILERRDLVQPIVEPFLLHHGRD